ncbi:unnamed protein product [Vitrella brassicaformis CCMP3155]|uniref:Uncharacterized protein n=1 Tax=Vitrella brassicaformis (strain CCMP3155) TaxID=1169540 RepID=A0A0G4H5Q7_VITBC|nr:unnamed protein product [Vitrella brassicaformis CCMP3155]|eukprot:CEM39150.1 unnamed protein product [Vitrella brassicaformis CCMP3155]
MDVRHESPCWVEKMTHASSGYRSLARDGGTISVRSGSSLQPLPKASPSDPLPIECPSVTSQGRVRC